MREQQDEPDTKDPDEVLLKALLEQVDALARTDQLTRQRIGKEDAPPE